MPDRTSALDDHESMRARVAELRRQREAVNRCSCEATGDIDVFGEPIIGRHPFCPEHGIYLRWGKSE